MTGKSLLPWSENPATFVLDQAKLQPAVFTQKLEIKATIARDRLLPSHRGKGL